MYRFEITVDGCRHKLVIHEAEVSDTAEYTVQIGDVSSSARVIVEGKYYIFVILYSYTYKYIRKLYLKVYT